MRGYLFKFICKIQTENERLKKIEIVFSLFVLTICQTFNFGSRAMFFCSLFFKLCSDQILWCMLRTGIFYVFSLNRFMLELKKDLSSDFDSFIAISCKYLGIMEWTSIIVNEFLKKFVVYVPEKVNGKCFLKVDIVFNFPIDSKMKQKRSS